MHSGPASSIVSSPPVPVHRAHAQSLTGMTTSKSGGFAVVAVPGSGLGDRLTRLSVVNCAARGNGFLLSSASRAGQPVSYGAVLDGEIVFVPGETPRQGLFAHWGRGAGSARLELIFPGGTYGIRKRMVAADLIPLAEALPALLAVGADERMRLSGQVWAAASAAGVGLIARGRLLPTVGADGTDVWRAGPLDPADLSWMRQLAAAFPPTAHPLAVPGSRPMRLRTPEALIRDLWDAIADLIARSPAAPRTTALPRRTS